MADTALLVARMEVSLRNLEKGMAKAGLIAEKGVRDIEKKFAAVNPKLPAAFGAQIGAAIASLVSAQAIQRVRELVGEVAKIADQAERIGVSAGNLQVFQNAVRLSGGSAEAASAGLETFSRKLSEAAQKGGLLADLFQANNVALRDQAGVLIPVQEQLGKVADLIKNASSEQDKLNIATIAFGQGAGPDLVLALSGGEEGLRKASAEAARLGGVIDSDLVQAARDLDAQFTQLEISADRFSQKLAISIGQWAIPAMERLIRGANRLAILLNTPITDFLSNPTKSFNAAVAQAEGPGLPEEFGGLNADFGGPSATIGGGRPTVVPPRSGRGGGRRSGGGRSSRTRRDTPGETIADLQNELRLTQAIGDEREEAKITLDTTNALQRAGVTATAAQKAQITELVRAIAEAEEAQKRFNEALDNIQDVAESGLSSFVSGLREGKSAVESLEGALNSVLDTILKIAQQQLMAGLFGQTPGGGALGGLLGGLFRGGGGAPIGAGGIGHMARGGITHGPSIAGEAGMEAVVPLPDGRRIPVAMQGGAGGDIQVVVNAPPGSRVASQRQERGPDFRRVIVDIVKDEFSGGGMDAPMQGRFGARPRKVR